MDERQAAEQVERQLGQLVKLSARLRRLRPDLTTAPVLAHLDGVGPQRMGAIAAAVGSDPSTVSRQVSALVAAGLVERRADPVDGRAQLLATTPAGARRCADARHRRTRSFAQVFAGWPAESRLRLAELLGRLADDLQEPDRTHSRLGGKN